MIIVSPYSRKLRNGNENPKNYLFWLNLIELLSNKNIVQVGVQGEKQLVDNFHIGLKLKELKDLIEKCEFWISVDNFFPHLANIVNKRGVVLWSISDPLIFGYSQNLNILKDRKYLRKNQFATWEEAEYNNEAYLTAEEVYKIIRKNGLL